MYKEIIKRIVLLIFICLTIYKIPYLKKYDKITRITVYRSLICIFFCLYSIKIIIKNPLYCIRKPYKCIKETADLHLFFIAYLFLDLLIMFIFKNKRIDLIFHHIIFLTAAFLTTNSYYKIYTNKVPIGISLFIIAELISIFSGFDKMAKENKNYDKSIFFKKYRKFIIKYIRIPIWLYILVQGFWFKKKITNYYFLSCLTSIIGIILDNIWYKKADKIINKIKNLKNS